MGFILIVIAHRGANKEALENTISSFKIAVELNIQRIELDIHATKDGVFVINHDQNLQKTCHQNINISEVSYLKLKTVPFINGDKILKLEGFLDNFIQNIEVNIEIKFEDPTWIESLIQMLGKYKKFHNKIVISSFHYNILENLSAKNLPYSIALLGEYSEKINEYYDFLETNKINIFHPYYKLVSEKMMAYCNDQNWQVYPYTGMEDEDLDREKTWNHLKNLNIMGLCTNYPRELKKWLNQ